VGAVGSAGSDERLKGFDRKLGQVLEIIPLQDPTRLAVGDTLAFKVLFKGEPLMHAHVSVIPRGVTLPPLGVETPYDMMTDEDGVARFTFTEANYHLIVVHQETDEAGTLDGKDYSFTKYAAALTTIVKPSRPGTAEEGKGDVLSAGIALLSYMGDLLLGAAR
jgi:ABC-type Co2+ transport system, periplasmic component